MIGGSLWDIYYLVKLNDNATENIDSINTASITYKNETVSDTAEVIILKEQIYPGIKKKYQLGGNNGKS